MNSVNIEEHNQIVNKRIQQSQIREFCVHLRKITTEQQPYKFSPGVVMILSEGDKLGKEIASLLSQNGLTPVLVSDRGFQTDTFARYSLTGVSDSEVADVFNKIRADFGNCLVGVLHVASVEKGYSVHRDYLRVKLVFLLAKYFYQNKAQDRTDTFFVNILRMEGKLGTSGRCVTPLLGGLFGLGKSLYQEWNGEVLVKVLDVSDKCGDSCAKTVFEEIFYGNRNLVELAIDEEQEKYCLVPEEQVPFTSSLNPPSESDVILVTGGGRGITSKCIIDLSKKYHCRFAILGRMVIDQDVVWLKDTKDKREIQKRIIEKYKAEKKSLTPMEVNRLTESCYAQLSVQRTLQELRNNGSEAVYFPCDIKDSDSVERTIETIRNRFGTITGLIHGSGVRIDKKIQFKNTEDFEAVVGTKILGLNNIMCCLFPEELRYVVFFSSIAAFAGSKGQTDYSIANEILNKTAYYLTRKMPWCHTVAINWGPWDYGMVDDSVKKMFIDRGISLISIEEGTEIFTEQFLFANKSQVVVFNRKNWI